MQEKTNIYREKRINIGIFLAEMYVKVGNCRHKYSYLKVCQWLIAQLVERSLSVMKDPGSNLGEDICSFHY